MYDKNKLNSALKLLDMKLSQKNFQPMNLVICGGSSLIITGLVSRTTMDVDVLAFATPSTGGSLQITEAEQLPQELLNSAKEVARDLGLDEKWLNNMPHTEASFGLPEGFAERLKKYPYGKTLTIYFVDRFDQIHFKLHAAVDQGLGRHVNDLITLKPLKRKWRKPQDGY